MHVGNTCEGSSSYHLKKWLLYQQSLNPAARVTGGGMGRGVGTGRGMGVFTHDAPHQYWQRFALRNLRSSKHKISKMTFFANASTWVLDRTMPVMYPSCDD